VKRILVFVFLVLNVILRRSTADDLRPFLRSQCFDCHAGEAREGGLDLSTLPFELASPQSFAQWERIHDRVANGEMPPKSTAVPKLAERAAFLKSLGDNLHAAHQASKGTVLRRLNRQEYQNTLNDLFGTNSKLVDRLPEDSRAHEFENVGEALSISMVQMQRYLECITTVLDEATQRTTEKPQSKLVKASYADTQGAEKWLGSIWLKRPDGAVVFFKSFGYPSGMLREANVRQDGWYKVRVTGYAYQSESPITFGLGASTFMRGVEQPTFGYFALHPGKPTTIETTAWIPARYMVEITLDGLTDRGALKQTPIERYKGPGLAVHSIEVEGPLVAEFPTRGHRLLFDGLQRDEVPPRNRSDRAKSSFMPKFEIKSADVTPALLCVASKAFRRPATVEQIKPFLALFDSELRSGATTEEALRAAVMAIFSSPDFLFLRERPGLLDDFALASRLSYFLTRTSPDEELLQLAVQGKLTRDPAMLMTHTERLLKHAHSERFVADFTDAWLNLRDINFTTPDGLLFPEFDPFLQWSMLAETRAFVRKLIDDNLGVGNLVKSDFAMLNNRLAEHYGIAVVLGPEIRPVKLNADSVRGGLLSQASVLKVSANGTNTSPVVRGVWVMERLLGQAPPPPPPGVPGVEPDIRGASTLRELLDKHRKLDSCRGCHQAIDPPGFALESFDPIGGWRDHFRRLGGGKQIDKEVRGRSVRYKLGPPVDASGQLLNGDTFNGFNEFRELLLRDQSVLAKALTAKLLIFATGREMGFSDRAEIERIVKDSQASQHGVRDLVRLVVASETFRRK